MPAYRLGSGAPFSCASVAWPGTARTALRSFAGTGRPDMTEELNKTEARQGDRRRTTQTVVLVGTPLAFVAMGIIYLIWA
jgi:hypothetical protein